MLAVAALRTKGKVMISTAAARNCVHIVALALTLCASLQCRVVAADVDPVARTVLNDMRRAISANRLLPLRIESDSKVDNGFKDAVATGGHQITEVHRCEKLERVIKTWRPSGATDSTMYEYLISEAGDVLAIQAMFDDSQHQKPINDAPENLLIVLSNKQLVNPGMRIRTKQTVYGILGDAAFAYWSVGNSPIEDYLESDQLAVNLTSSGADVKSEGKLGEFSAELSKEHGWLPRKFSIIKLADSEIEGRAIRNIFDAEVPEGVLINEKLPKIVIERMEWHCTVVDFARSTEGVWYPSEISYVGRTVFGGGGVNSGESRVLVSLRDQADGDSCKPSIEIPIGFQVGVEGAPHLPHRWDGEKAVPGLQDLPSRGQKGPLGALQVNKTRIMIIAINVAIVAILVIVILLKRWRKLA
jgi:hypothetical protein